MNRRPKDADNAPTITLDQNALIKVSTKPRNAQDLSEEVIKTLPDSPVLQ